jgi:predicted HTH transcriptional regulator
MLEPRQLNETDEQILEFMASHGRVTPSWVAEETDNPRAYVSQRLKRLKEHNHVEQPHRGLWDLTDDPRDTEVSDSDD